MVAIYDQWSHVTIFPFFLGPSPAISVSGYWFEINKIEEYVWTSHVWHEA
jgi:hypothetical protein